MAKKKRKRKGNNKPMLFSAFNYKLLSLGAFLIALGFIIMYLENKVLGFFSLYICPIIILGGYGVVLASLLKHDPEDNSQPQTTSS